jgi:hypothetical protein
MDAIKISTKQAHLPRLLKKKHPEPTGRLLSATIV